MKDQTSTTGVTRPVGHRDRLSFTLYGWMAAWGWLLYSFNPSVPLIAREMRISNAVAGLHGTAIAVGVILAGVVTPRLVARFGRRTVLIAAGSVVAAGTLILVTGPGIAWTLSGMLVLSVGANAAVGSAQVALVLRHKGLSSASLAEANGVGSSIGLLGPLAVGAGVAVGWGWRPAVAVTGLLALGTAFAVSRLPARGPLSREVSRSPSPTTRIGEAPDRNTPVRATGAGGPPRRLPNSSWFYLAALVAGAAIETATTFWSADLLIERSGAGPAIATAAVAGLVAGMSVIRFVVGPLSLRIDPAHLLAAAFGVAIIGWAVLWAATTPSVALAGLVLAGFGYGAQYPLAASLLLVAARGATDRAQARAMLAGGLAIGIAPFVLGALADSVGTHTAFVLVPVLAIIGASAALAGPGSVSRELALQERADAISG